MGVKILQASSSSSSRTKCSGRSPRKASSTSLAYAPHGAGCNALLLLFLLELSPTDAARTQGADAAADVGGGEEEEEVK